MSELKIYRIETPEDTFLFIAKDAKSAFLQLIEDRENIEIEDVEIYEHPIVEGELFHYDCEDLYYSVSREIRSI